MGILNNEGILTEGSMGILNSKTILTEGSNDPNDKKLLISCKEMFSNPTGKGSGFVAARYRIKDSMTAAFLANMRRHRFKFVCQPYRKPDGGVVFWVKVPSRSYDINRITYDVVIDIPAGKGDMALRPATFYSNSPSFIFTYCYVFYHSGILVPWLSDRVPTEAKENAPVVRNPIQSMGYELILYQALSYIVTGGCLTDYYVAMHGRDWNAQNKLEIQSKVSDPETLVSIYNQAAFLARKNHRKPVSHNEKAAKKKAVREFADTEGKRTPLQAKPKLFAKSAHSKLSYRQAKAKMGYHKAP